MAGRRARTRQSTDLPPDKDCRARVEGKSPRRILKRPCAAEIVEAIFVQKSSNFGGAIGRDFGSDEPALDFGSKIVGGREKISLQIRIAKKLEQFTERKRSNVRWIAQNFPAILICSTLGKFAGENVFHDDFSAAAADARHFAQDSQRLLEMMERQPADRHVKRPIFKRKMLRISGAERDIRDAPLFGAISRDRQHRVGQVHADGFACTPSKGLSNVARSRRDIQHAFVAGETSRNYQSADALFVRYPGIRGKGLRLRCERFSNDVVVFTHLKILARQPRWKRNANQEPFGSNSQPRQRM